MEKSEKQGMLWNAAFLKKTLDFFAFICYHIKKLSQKGRPVYMNSANSRGSVAADTRTLVLLAIFCAIEVIFCFTPLGSLPVTPGIVATLSHVPVLVAAILLGKKCGAIMGGVMGVCSLIWWSTIGVAYPTAFAFTPLGAHGNVLSAVIAVLPRLLFGLVAACVYDALKGRLGQVVAASVTGVVATACHSLMVLGMIYICFSGNGELTALLGGNFVKMVIGWAGVNAIFEILIGGVVSGALIKPLGRIYRRT